MLLQVCLAWGVHDYWFEYIASSVNIADAPSRFVPLLDLPSAYGPIHYLDAIWPPTSELTDPTTAIPRCTPTRGAGVGAPARARALSTNAARALARGEDRGCCPGAQCPPMACEQRSAETTGAPPGSGVLGRPGELIEWEECVCEMCAPGTVQPLPGQRHCVECPPGWHQTLSGKARCEQCVPGTFNPHSGLGRECSPCPPGTYSYSRPEEFRAATGGALAPAIMPSGVPPHVYDPLAAAARCTLCPAGTHQPLERASLGADACLPCAAGTYSDDGAAHCTPCPLGTFNPYSGQPGEASCKPCEPGACNDEEGAEYCWQCCPLRSQACSDDMRQAKGVYPNTYGEYQRMNGEPEESVQRGHLFEGEYATFPTYTINRQWNNRPTYAPLRGSMPDTDYDVGKYIDPEPLLDTYTMSDLWSSSSRAAPPESSCQTRCDYFGCSTPTLRSSDGCRTLDDSWVLSESLPANEHVRKDREDDWVARTEERYAAFYE
eukprot:PRCOL_00000173-RA